MQTVKQSVARALPCLLIQSVDGQTPETGALAGSVTISYRKEGATAWSSKTASGNWTEITPGKGAYLISWSTSDFNTVGRFDFVVEHASCINFYGSYDVSANLLDDIDATLDALNDLAQSDILSDATPFDGAKIDAAITSRSSHAAADVIALMNDPTAAAIADAIWDEAAADHTGVGSFGEAIDTLITNIDVVLSTRSSHSAADVDTTLTASHGAGSWTSASPPSAAAIADAVWDEAAGDHTGAGSFGESIDTLTTNIDVVLSTRSSHDAADVDTTLTAAHGAGSWTGSSAADVADAVWDEAAADHTAAGSFGEAIDTLTTNIDVILSTRSSHSAADVDTQLSGVHGAGSWEGGGAAPTVDEIADAVWDEIASGHVGAGSFGEAIDTLTTNIDVVLSTRSSHSAADVDTQLSGVHGAGSWEGGGAAPTVSEIADAVLEELIADHTSISGSLADVIDEIHNYHLSPRGHVEWE